jgi:hypothetical protein
MIPHVLGGWKPEAVDPVTGVMSFNFPTTGSVTVTIGDGLSDDSPRHRARRLRRSMGGVS